MTTTLRSNAWIAVLLLGVVLAALHLSGSESVATGAYYVAAGLAVGAFILATHRNRGNSTRPWQLLTAGMALYVIGDVIWDLLDLTTGVAVIPAYGSAPFYVSALLLSSLAFLQWSREAQAGNEREDTIDAAIVTVSFAIVSWIFVIGPRLDAPTVVMNSDLSAIVFATLDLFPLALLVRMALRRGHRRYRALGLFVVGGMVITLADSLYGWGELTGNVAAYESLADVGWLAWYILWGAAALDPTSAGIATTTPARDIGEASSTRRRFAVLATIALVAPLAIVFGALENRPLDTALVAFGTIILFALVIYRMLLVVRQLETALVTQERLQAELTRVAYHDALTGLYNRAYLNSHLDRLLHARGTSDLAVLFLDLDNFKDVNDRFGHAGGDRLLVELARRLEACAREADIVARLGGDEFLVVLDLNGRDAPATSAALARDILRSLAAPVQLAGAETTISASIGIAWTRAGDTSADSILGAADRAMYAAKQAGKNRFSVATITVPAPLEAANPLKRSA